MSAHGFFFLPIPAVFERSSGFYFSIEVKDICDFILLDMEK